MSKKRADQIRDAGDILQTNQGRSDAFYYLLGALSARAEGGKAVSATSIAAAVVHAVEYASETYAEKKAREGEQAWRSAAETELPEPREVPDLDPTRFSHAMTGIGEENSWCGAPGPVAVFAFSVTCPVCRAMLSREEEGDLAARMLARVRLPETTPLAGDTIAGEREPAEIVVGEGRYGDAELDGLACISCHQEFAVGEASVPWGVIPGGPQVFAHPRCVGIPDAALAMVAEARRNLPRLAAAVIDGSTPKAAAEDVIEEWTPKASTRLPQPRKLWVHSGPCVYCAHGPGCVTCDLTDGPHWGAGSPGHEYPGPVCDNCSAECKRREIAADPYYSGDYVTMFGDDE